MNNNFLLVSLTALVLTACGGKTKETSEASTTPKIEAAKIGELKIAYYLSDSLKTQFDYYRVQDSLVTKKQLAFQKEIERKTKELQSYISNRESDAKSGLLSQNEIMMVQQKAQQMEGELMRYQQERGASLEKETMEKLTDIQKKITAFGKEFSEKNKIDILLIHAEGGQINFITEGMNVTKEFIEFLNQRQKDIEKGLK
ncbi:MAG: OmpH family outer membrane protein [Bacteroidota bacterium]